ncbi:cytidine deaminase [Alicyclobacillus ferrooxydans]|uniref:cytidine deaminase n=1 Tax=Alicyclobacillus ferrooxydans TaxID=471514 RepID=UPI001470678B
MDFRSARGLNSNGSDAHEAKSDAQDAKSGTQDAKSGTQDAKSDARFDNLLQSARDAMEKAYVPYSGFPVGAALRLANGQVVTGANIENASYGLTNCAERTAVFRAMMQYDIAGKDRIVEIAVVADSDGAISPCGACRQVLAEFCRPDVPVALADLKGDQLQTTISQLLPYAFDAHQMDDR